MILLIITLIERRYGGKAERVSKKISKRAGPRLETGGFCRAEGITPDLAKAVDEALNTHELTNKIY
jgi:hypothetical protein